MRTPKILVSIACLFLLLAGALRAQAPQGDVVAQATALLDALVRGDFAGAARDFDARMKEGLPVGELQATWQSLVAQVGPLRGKGAPKTSTAGGYRVVVVPCEFEKARLDMKVSFDAQGRVAGLFFLPPAAPPPAPDAAPPPYAKKDAFREQEVTVGAGEWALPGTLSLPLLPVGTGPVPAVVLVHGSGPNDRDETVGANRPFRDLAWGLASRGIAVLRYDKRTKVHPEKLSTLPRLTVREETIDDALAAVALLRRTAGIDPRRVYVLGHSLGGMLVPRIAKADPQLAGLIIMAGTTRPLEDVIVEQLTYLGMGKEQLEAARQQAAAVKALHEGSTETILGAPASYWLDLRDYHPAEAAKSVVQPLLILQGERDYQVTMADFQGWKTALAGRPNVTFHTYPQLNHLFLAGEGKSLPQEYQTPGHVAAAVIDDIAGWILKRPAPTS